MFCHIFGEYLVNEKKLTQNQLSAVLDYLQTIRVKLGFIAVAEKMLTQTQVAEINLMQNKMDRRFGDIAVTKGDLTEEQLNYLLGLQGNAYLQFVQALMDLEFMNMPEFEQAVLDYQKKSEYTDAQLEAIKSGDIDRVADVLIQVPDQESNELARLCLRNMNRFINNNFYFGKAYMIDEVEAECFVYQWVKGKEEWFLGFASDRDGLLTISNLYAREVYDNLNEQAIGIVEEFIHCTNSLYLSKDLHKKEKEHILKAQSGENVTVKGQNKILVVPASVNGRKINILVGMGDDTKIITH